MAVDLGSGKELQRNLELCRTGHSSCPQVTRSREALHTDPEHIALIPTGGWIVPTSGTHTYAQRALVLLSKDHGNPICGHQAVCRI